MTETSAATRGEGGATSHSAARPASTVIVIRRAATVFEVLIVRRLASASSFADVYVFPGGGVRAEAGALPLVFPTRMHLRRLAACATYDDALAYARAKRIVTVQPTLGRDTTPEHFDPFDERAEW